MVNKIYSHLLKDIQRCTVNDETFKGENFCKAYPTNFNTYVKANYLAKL